MENTTEDRLGTSSLKVARHNAKAIDTEQDRVMADREVTENRELSEDERVDLFRQEHYTDVLPSLPNIPGWHICWLTTTNKHDTVQRRMRLGYKLCKPEDFPGLDLFTIGTGDYVGCIGVNEMIAAKLPESLYQKYMAISHHEEPLRQQEGIVARVDQLKEDARSMEAKVFEGDGMSELRQSAPRLRQFS